MNHIKELETLIAASVSPYHCIMAAADQLASAGFKELPLAEPWGLAKGGSYYINAFDSTLVAFSIGEELGEVPALKLAASHTDWPCLKVKPSPEITSLEYGKLNVEVYGGPLLGTWFDRPLSMAGKVCVAGESPMKPETVFVDFSRPLLTVPSLAIHMNREANNGVAINAQVDMLPLIARITEELSKEHFFLEALAKEAGVKKEEILDYEIYIYNREEGTLLGLQNEFYSSPRLDNLTSVQACLKGIMAKPCKNSINVIALYDNEEIGSHTKQGASSALMERILEKLCLSLGYSRETFLNVLMSGFLLSLDVAHAIHPNHGEKCDIKNQIVMGDGVAIKLSASQSYATDASSTGVIESICRKENIPYKKFSNRSDMRGGSTLGSISSALLTMRTVDAGVPILAMHSAREIMGTRDQEALVRLAEAFFQI
ncbi:M18 family aminopeptidase [Lacrimispora sp.]|uniref:M18 family aminopeptidase n=1 Tax=Lacrimispora sp. TaxID=2719234 RepID=UPI002FDAE4A2